MKYIVLTLCLIIASCSHGKMSYTGKAENTQMGAAINQKGRIMYIEGLRKWPSEALNKNVTVTGELVEKHTGGAILKNDKKEMVIEKPEWKLVE